MRIIFLVTFFGVSLSGLSQDLSGTWEGSFYSDRLGKRSDFFIRIYLEQEDDFVWGMCEAMSVEKNRIRAGTDSYENELKCRYPVSGAVPVILKKNSLIAFSTQNSNSFFMMPGFCETISSFLLYYDVEDSIARLSGEWISSSGIVTGVIGNVNRVVIKRMSGKTPGFIEEFHPGREKRLMVNVKKDENDKKGKDKFKIGLFKKKVDKESDTDKKREEKDTLIFVSDDDETGEKIRTQDIQQVVELETGLILVDIYDNGMIDGDVVSLYLNGEKIANQVKLTARPLQLKLELDKSKENEFRLFADNVGEIPPNTALMIIRAGEKRYEVNLSASLQKDAIVILKVKKPLP